MTEETKTIQSLARTAKAALLEAIAEAAENENRPDGLEYLARAYASVVGSGPKSGDVAES